MKNLMKTAAIALVLGNSGAFANEHETGHGPMPHGLHSYYHLKNHVGSKKLYSILHGDLIYMLDFETDMASAAYAIQNCTYRQWIHDGGFEEAGKFHAKKVAEDRVHTWTDWLRDEMLKKDIFSRVFAKWTYVNPVTDRIARDAIMTCGDHDDGDWDHGE